MTSCAPASSISTLHPQQAILGASNNTIESSFQICCTKISGAYTSPEGDCYSHCYYYNAASASRLQSCFNKTLDNPNDSTLDFKMFTDVPLSSNATITSSASVQTLIPIATPSYAFSNSSSINATSVTALSGNSTILSNQTSSVPIVTSTALSTAGSSGNSTATSIVIAPGPPPTVVTPASGTSNAPATTSKSKASRGVTASVGTIAVVGLAFLAVFV